MPLLAGEAVAGAINSPSCRHGEESLAGPAVRSGRSQVQGLHHAYVSSSRDRYHCQDLGGRNPGSAKLILASGISFFSERNSAPAAM